VLRVELLHVLYLDYMRIAIKNEIRICLLCFHGHIRGATSISGGSGTKVLSRHFAHSALSGTKGSTNAYLKVIREDQTQALVPSEDIRQRPELLIHVVSRNPPSKPSQCVA